jgi:pSer/pThr/pTyr-binding forkhead associated (FHA) protein
VVERSPVLAVGTEIRLLTQVTLGRALGNDVRLDDPFVSSSHVRLIPQGPSPQGWSVTVEDLSSTNGTYVNEKRITEAQLTQGARLRVGETVFRFEQ